MADFFTLGADFTSLILYLFIVIGVLIVLSVILRGRIFIYVLMVMTFVAITTLIGLILINNYGDGTLNNSVFILVGTIIVSSLIPIGGINRLVLSPLRYVTKKTKSQSQGNFTLEAGTKVRGIGETRSLIYSSNDLSKKLRGMLISIKNSNTDLNTAAETLAASSEEVAATTEEVTATVQTIAEGAIDQVRRLELVSNILNEMMTVTEESIREINQTSKITLDLSEQTNLVSLNAAIEASKAGEQGIGFTVVADHVRQLSVESKAAANSINKIVKRISIRMRQSVDSIVNAVDKIAGVAENTAASSQEAAAAAEEQSASLQEITDQAQKLTMLSDNTTNLLNDFRLD